MAEQAEKMPQEHNLEPTEVLLVVSDVPESEQMENVDKKQSLLVPEAEEPDNNVVDSNPCNHVKLADDHEEAKPPRAVQEFTKATDLPENEKKALLELKSLVQQALNAHEFGAASTSQEPPKADQPEQEKDTIPPATDDNSAKVLSEDDGAKTLEAIEESIVASVNEEACAEPGPQEVFIWGVKLLEDDKTDTVLLKFLRARDFKVKEAFTMLKNTIKWRKEFGIDELLEKELGDHELGRELEKAVFMHGCSKEGHPVCYNVYGEFKDKELYHKLFSDEEKRDKFLKWRVWFLERSVRKLDFGPAGVSTIVHVNDLRNSPGPNRWELRQATNQALQLLQDNYPVCCQTGGVFVQVFINVPWWYLALSKMISPFLTQRTKSKFVVAGPSTSAETLLKYISAEQIPAQYGGLSMKDDGVFGAGDCATEVIMKPSAKHIVEFPVTQACIVKWEARVVGWEVSYGAEFVPAAEDGYTVIIQKARRIVNVQEQHVISSSYKAGEPGKLVLTFNNLASKKKMLLYRFKTDQLSLN